MEIRVSPSVLNADLATLASEIARIPGADSVHLDVMDNHFVPNMTFGLPVVQSLRAHTTLPMDVHLMIDNADRWAPGFAEIGCESVTFHVEASENPVALARILRALGSRAAAAFKPETRLEDYLPLIEEVDMLLIMTVEPGFGGQPFLTSMLRKIEKARKLIDALGKDIWIQVDGGIHDDTVAQAAQAGANVFVAGSAAFYSNDPDKVVARLRSLAQAAVEA
ncbi:MAG: ribulose-phosphate 3-epimerase [Propionibacteriaceae bacterium]|nr:ribulose-phosphate 3-epimerase [Propionibacteriaceae bacterium]